MRPYFEAHHAAGLIMLVVSLAWGAMELAKAGSDRPGATSIGGGGRRLAIVPVMAAAVAAVYLGPRLIPQAAIRPGIAAFVIGIAIMLGGLALRGWSIRTLGEYFTGRVMVSADQPVITAGPYRVVRHPSYTGLLLACAGYGLAAANWASMAIMVLLPLAVFLWRIRAEENALLATLGDRYRGYAAQHKRLIPYVW